MGNRCKVQIAFVNGSSVAVVCGSYLEARDYCREKISLTGGRVKRLEVHCPDGSVFAIWDKDWDAISQHAGLHNT